jgi:hypothetical protein
LWSLCAPPNHRWRALSVKGNPRERAQELKAARRGPRADKADGESAVLAKIAEMPEPDQTMAKRLHAIVKASAPALSPKLWYGMPAYARNGKVVCFFQSAQKFNTRYATLGSDHKSQADLTPLSRHATLSIPKILRPPRPRGTV